MIRARALQDGREVEEVALEDLQVGERQRPKIEQYEDQVVLVFYGALTGNGDRPTRLFEVDLVVGHNYLLTFHAGALVDPGPLTRRVNTVARNLAAYVAIFAVVAMISGIYGMNFHHMPELGWRFGYAWALGLMVASAGALWVYFKRKGWL